MTVSSGSSLHRRRSALGRRRYFFGEIMRKAVLAILVLVVLAGCLPTPEPTPTEVYPPRPEAEYAAYTEDTYFPIFAKSYRYDGIKAGLAVVSYRAGSPWSNTPYDGVRLGVGWWYNWSPYPDFNKHAPLLDSEFVPMLWGKNPRAVATMKYTYGCPEYDGPVLWLNEPDLYTQADATPAEGVALLEEIIRVCPRAKVIGPQMGPFDREYQWLKSFWKLWVDKHGAPPPTTMSIHIYNTKYPERWIDALYEALPDYAGKVWITEFAYCGGGDRKEAFLKHLRVFNEDSRVERFAVFANRLQPGVEMWDSLACNEIYDDRNKLTETGLDYLTWINGLDPYP